MIEDIMSDELCYFCEIDKKNITIKDLIGYLHNYYYPDLSEKMLILNTTSLYRSTCHQHKNAMVFLSAFIRWNKVHEFLWREGGSAIGILWDNNPHFCMACYAYECHVCPLEDICGPIVPAKDYDDLVYNYDLLKSLRALLINELSWDTSCIPQITPCEDVWRRFHG